MVLQTIYKIKESNISGQYQLDQSTIKLEYYRTILYSLSLAITRESLEEIRHECMECRYYKKSKKPTLL